MIQKKASTLFLPNHMEQNTSKYASGYFTWSECLNGLYACGYEINNNNIELSFYTAKGIRY